MEKDTIKNVVSGVLVVDKPVGLTSHDVVQIIRRGTGIGRAGHTGTLDPRASGVLVILVGPAVRLSEYVSASDKRYQATVLLGASTDTYDAEGTILSTRSVEDVTEESFAEILQTFIGEIIQVPPPYSAVKVKGRKAYEMAREGEEVTLEPRTINVYSLEILEWSLGRTDFLLIYFGSVIGGNLLSLYVHRHHDYLSYGASGGVCGIIFAYLLLFPGVGIMVYLALPIPGWLYAIGFLVGSFVAMKRAKDNIGHDAHLGGAIVGLLIAAALHPKAALDNWKIFLLVFVFSALI